jgi:hypothetical protein
MSNRILALAIVIPFEISACASVGPNALVVPILGTVDRTLNYATDKAFRKEPEKIDQEAILAAAKETCTTKQLTEAECAKAMAKAKWATDLAEKVQGLNTVAQAQRDAEFQASWRPENVARDMVTGAVDQATMLQSASLQAQLSPAGMAGSARP